MCPVERLSRLVKCTCISDSVCVARFVADCLGSSGLNTLWLRSVQMVLITEVLIIVHTWSKMPPAGGSLFFQFAWFILFWLMRSFQLIRPLSVVCQPVPHLIHSVLAKRHWKKRWWGVSISPWLQFGQVVCDGPGRWVRLYPRGSPFLVSRISRSWCVGCNCCVILRSHFQSTSIGVPAYLRVGVRCCFRSLDSRVFASCLFVALWNVILSFLVHSRCMGDFCVFEGCMLLGCASVHVVVAVVHKFCICSANLKHVRFGIIVEVCWAVSCCSVLCSSVPVIVF